MNSPSTISFTTITGTSSSRPSSRRGSVSTDDTSGCGEPYFQLSPAPATPQPPQNFSRSPSQSVKRKPRKKCKDLSHYNSVPPIGHMSRSNSNSFSPSLSLISPTESCPKSPRSYHAPKSPQEHSPRIGNRSPSEPKSPRKSPLTPTSNHFNFPPSPSYSTKSPGTSKRKFSFSGPPKSPKSPSTESAVDGETMATSLSRPSSPRGLAYLASRRGSRESNISNVSNEELAPLNFTNTARGRQRRTSNFLELPVPDHIRPRVCSLPEKPYNPRSGDELYRLRTFSITNKGVVNYGDSIINRRSRSNTSVNSTASRHSNHSGVSNNSPWEGSCCGSSYNNISTETSGEEVAKYRVVLLGDSGVGKTALVSQFMTSEYCYRHSNHSGVSNNSPWEGSCCGSCYNNISTETSGEEVAKYRVVLLGDSGVGKTALVSQFMTSEYCYRHSNHSGVSNNSPWEGSCCGSSYNNISTETSGEEVAKHRVVLLGSSGVGKTALVSQFMTSEYCYRHSNHSGVSNNSPWEGSCCGSSYNNISTETSGEEVAKHRVVLLGSSGVGKTALVSQFMTSEYCYRHSNHSGVSNNSPWEGSCYNISTETSGEEVAKYRVVLLGDSGVWKTALVSQYMTSEYCYRHSNHSEVSNNSPWEGSCCGSCYNNISTETSGEEVAKYRVVLLGDSGVWKTALVSQYMTSEYCYRHSNHSGVSNNSPWEGSCCGSSYNNISTETSGEEVAKYRVVLLGDSGVGKTAIVSQFMTSEYCYRHSNHSGVSNNSPWEGSCCGSSYNNISTETSGEEVAKHRVVLLGDSGVWKTALVSQYMTSEYCYRHSNHSEVSNNSPWEGSCCGSCYNNISTETSGEEVAKYRVVLLGDSGVGKTAIVSQFMTSEYCYRHSNHSEVSNNSPWEGSCCGSSYNNISTETSGEEVAKHRVVLLGDSGVWKTALVSQFMTSEYCYRHSNHSGVSNNSPCEGSCCGSCYNNISTETSGEEVAKYRVVLLGDSGVWKTALVSQFKTSEYCYRHSNHSEVSNNSPWEGSCCGSCYNNISTETSDEEVAKYRVVLLGDSGVGKTALVSQFMTSEYCYNHSNHSEVSNNGPWEGSCCGSSYNNISTETSGEEVAKHRVVLLGDSGVWKTALVSQFMTSEYCYRHSNHSGVSNNSPCEGSCCGSCYNNISTETSGEEVAKYRVVLLGDSGVWKTALVSQFKTSEYCYRHSNHSEVSNNSPWEGSCCGSCYNNISTETSDEEVAKYRVVLLGDSGVGKTALVSQFMTSEYCYNHSNHSEVSNNGPWEGSCCGSSYNNISTETSGEEVAKHRVVLLGDSGVWKTALVSQFMTSEYCYRHSNHSGVSNNSPWEGSCYNISTETSGEEVAKYRVVLLGDSGVWKTALVSQYMTSEYCYRHSNHSEVSNNSPWEGSCCGSCYNNISTETSGEEVAKYRVVLLGDSGVGKTALVSQFMTSEYCYRHSNHSGVSNNSPWEGSCCGSSYINISTETSGEEVAKYRVVLLGDSGVWKTALVSQFKTSEYCYRHINHSEVSNNSPWEGSCCGSCYNNISTETSDEEVAKHRVVLLGDSGVWKTALVSQFMTSEYCYRHSNHSGVSNNSPWEGSCCGSCYNNISTETSGEEVAKYRVVLLGDSGVWKTALVLQFMTSEYCYRHSNHSGVSNNSPWEGSCCGSSYNNISTETSGEEVAKYRVVLLGDSGVGKTALVSQFMTSEYMNTYDASLDDEFGEKTVSVLLDGEESEMVFIDHPNVEMSVENSLSTYEPHACVVVYSIVNRASLKVAEEILNYLWRESYTKDKSVIVVGNKADLARSRVITANEGKALAASRDCKFIETSSGIQHNVDELLVGILKQIRLRETRDKKRARRGVKRLHGSKTSLSLNIAREILHKMCLTDGKSKSCENLHVL